MYPLSWFGTRLLFFYHPWFYIPLELHFPQLQLNLQSLYYHQSQDTHSHNFPTCRLQYFQTDLCSRKTFLLLLCLYWILPPHFLDTLHLLYLNHSNTVLDVSTLVYPQLQLYIVLLLMVYRKILRFGQPQHYHCYRGSHIHTYNYLSYLLLI